jgi:TonB family protein
MIGQRVVAVPLLFSLAVACRAPDRAEAERKAAAAANDVPVALNGDSVFGYPPEAYRQGIEGEVRLRLYVDSAGRVVPESTRVASSSGTPALDSAAMASAADLRFAPAHRAGVPVAATFQQPVIFRRNAGAPPPPLGRP